MNMKPINYEDACNLYRDIINSYVRKLEVIDGNLYVVNSSYYGQTMAYNVNTKTWVYSIKLKMLAAQ